MSGAAEIFTTDFIKAISVVPLYTKVTSDLDVIEINRQYATIFQWISLFDFNILIIIIIVVVGVINMSTALLVLILERSSMIGLFKSLGAEII